MIPKRAPAVLVVEDDAKVRSPLGELLLEAGYGVYAATDGERGLRLAREYAPDLVLLDLVLPGIDGWEVLRRLRLDSGTASIPAVIVTALPVPAEEVVGRGAQGHLRKPFTFAGMSREIDRLLGRSGAAAVDLRACGPRA